jgi:hypothetical protein
MVTFKRTLQSTIEDILYARGMSRLRHLFLEYAPDMKPYFILSASDDAAATLKRMGMEATLWQILPGTPGTIAVITSVIGGTFVGLLLDALFTPPLLVCVSAGIVFFLASVGFSLWYHRLNLYRTIQSPPTLFPDSSKH